MASVNKVILVGNLGRDPELKYTPQKSAVATFSIATTERFTGRDGQKQEKTEWHNIVVWNKLAELANQYLKKGRSVYIEGKLTTRSWDDKDGNKKYRTEVVANQMQFLGGPGEGQGGGGRAGGGSAEGFNEPPMPSEADMGMSGSGSALPAEDDLPF